MVIRDVPLKWGGGDQRRRPVGHPIGDGDSDQCGGSRLGGPVAATAAGGGSVSIVAQLTDPNEGPTFTGASWAWHRRADEAAAWQPVPTGAVGAADNYPELSSYTPPASDVGYHLQATVRYTDNEGPNKSAESAATDAEQEAVPRWRRALVKLLTVPL